jgi:hypothetical protein
MEIKALAGEVMGKRRFMGKWNVENRMMKIHENSMMKIQC